MSEHRITYVTTPVEVSEQIANILVENDLAVCVNIIEKVRSIYKWEGKVEKSVESLLIIKAMTKNTEALIAKVKEIHPYETPEVISYDIVAGNQDYLDWLSGKEIKIEDEVILDEEEIELEDETEEEIEEKT